MFKWTKRKSKVSLLLMVVMSVLLISACGNDSSTAKTVTLQPASWQEKGFWASHIDYFAEYVNENAEGVKVEPTMPGSIVPVDKQIDAVDTNTTAAMAPPSAYLTGKIPLGYVWSTPPAVETVDEMIDLMEVFEGGRAGELMKEEIEKVYKVEVVGYMYGPADTLISSRLPIDNIEDIDGLKFRVGAGAIAETLTDLGAATVFSPASEIYTMLSTKSIDATVMGSPDDHLSNSFDEVTEYWLRSPSLNSVHATIMCVNRGVWEGLSEADQVVLGDAIKKGTDRIKVEGREKIDSAWGRAEEKGVKVIDWSEEDQKTWHSSFYAKCLEYSDDPAYVEFMDILGRWAVENNKK